MRIYAILAGVILVLCLGLWYSLSAAFTARAELASAKVSLDVVIAQNQGLQAAAADIQTNVQVTTQKATAVRRGVEHEVAKEPDWASALVPAAIVDELCASLHCTTPSTR